MNTRIWIATLICIVSILFVSPQAKAEGNSFNNKYAAPFGTEPDVRVENEVRFSYFTKQGAISGLAAGQNVDIDKPAHGGVFAIQLAMEDFVSFELKTIWTRIAEKSTFYSCAGSDRDCALEKTSYADSNIVIGLTPKYRFLTNDWFWGTVSLEVLFPLSTGKSQTKDYLINPGLQMFFDTGDWFGIEVDTSLLMAVADPESDEQTDVVQVPTDNDRKFIAGIFARVNFLLKLYNRHFINLQIDDTAWFHELDSERNEYVRRIISGERELTTEQDRFDKTYFSNHQLNVGLGYRVNLSIFEAGFGGWVAVTDRDRRQDWGLNLDTRFTF